MQEAKLEHRFFAWLIDCLIISGIFAAWIIIYVRIPNPPNNPSTRMEALRLILHGLCLIITGTGKIVSIASPVLLLIDKITSLITPILHPTVIWIYLIYYFFFERWLKATPGKIIVGIRVSTNNDKPITTFRILIRTLSRILPLEAFSYLPFGNNFWHDKLSKTHVIYKNSAKPFLIE